MDYTILARSTVTGDLLKKHFFHIDSMIDLEAAINTWVQIEGGHNKVPYAWCEGQAGDDIIGHMDDQDLRKEAASAWVREGRAIACFTDDGKQRYVPQRKKTVDDILAQLRARRGDVAETPAVTPEAPKSTVKRVVRKPAATKPEYKLHNFGERGLTENLDAYQQYMEALLGGTLPVAPPSNAKPPIAGLLRCSTGARNRDHLVQASFGSAWLGE